MPAAFSRSFWVALTLVTLAGSFPLVRGQDNHEKPTRPPRHQLMTKGLLTTRAFPYQFRTANLRVEIRNLIMGRAKAEQVPTPSQILMELRGGSVVTTINGESRERVQGDFWTVEKGSALTLESRGEYAVIRAIYIFPGSK